MHRIGRLVDFTRKHGGFAPDFLFSMFPKCPEAGRYLVSFQSHSPNYEAVCDQSTHAPPRGLRGVRYRQPIQARLEVEPAGLSHPGVADV